MEEVKVNDGQTKMTDTSIRLSADLSFAFPHVSSKSTATTVKSGSSSPLLELESVIMQGTKLIPPDDVKLKQAPFHSL